MANGAASSDSYRLPIHQSPWERADWLELLSYDNRVDLDGNWPASWKRPVPMIQRSAARHQLPFRFDTLPGHLRKRSSDVGQDFSQGERALQFCELETRPIILFERSSNSPPRLQKLTVPSRSHSKL